MKIDKLTKQEMISLVDNKGTLLFDSWYKGKLKYTNSGYTVIIIPDYRDDCAREETLDNLLCCEDYQAVAVYAGLDKPFESEWYKKGAML